MDHNKQRETKLTLFSFFLAGTSLWIFYPLIFIAGEDILSGLALPTSVISISISVPGLFVALTSPIFFDRIGVFRMMAFNFYFLMLLHVLYPWY